MDCACDYDGTAGTVVSAHDILKGCDAANGSQAALQGVALILLRTSGHLLLIVQRSSLDWEDLSPKVGIPKAAHWKLKLQIIPWPGRARLHRILQCLRKAENFKRLKHVMSNIF